MKFDQAIVTALIYDLQFSGSQFGEAKDELDRVMKSVEEFYSLVVDADESYKTTLGYLAAKCFYLDPDLTAGSLLDSISSFEQASEQTVTSAEFVTLFRTIYKVERFLICLLISDKVTSEWFEGYKKKFNVHLGKFISSLSSFIAEVHAPNKKFLCLNLVESFLSDSINESLSFISKSPELTDIFVKDPDKLLVRIFSETISQLELAFYASEELLG